MNNDINKKYKYIKKILNVKTLVIFLIIFTLILIYIFIDIYYDPYNKLIRDIEKIEQKTHSKILFVVDNFWGSNKYLMPKFMKERIFDIDDEDDFINWIKPIFNTKKTIKLIFHTRGGSISSSDMIANILLKYKVKPIGIKTTTPVIK